MRSDPVAWIAVGLGAVACCPVAALGGLLAGALSLARIRRSDGRLTGQRIAWTGILLSVVVGATSLLVAERLQAAQTANSLSAVRSAVEQTLSGSVDASAWWVREAHPGLIDFQREMAKLVAPVTVGATTQTETLIGNPPVGRFRLVIQTRSGDAIGSVDALLVTDWSTWLPGPRLRSIEIALPRPTTAASSEASVEGSGESPEQSIVRYPRVDPPQAGATLPRDG